MSELEEIIRYFREYGYDDVEDIEEEYLINVDIIHKVYEMIYKGKDGEEIEPHIKGMYYGTIEEYEKKYPL